MQGVVQLKNWARKERLALKDNLVLRKKKKKREDKKKIRGCKYFISSSLVLIKEYGQLFLRDFSNYSFRVESS